MRVGFGSVWFGLMREMGWGKEEKSRVRYAGSLSSAAQCGLVLVEVG